MWQGWFDLAAGIWLIISAFIPSIQTPASIITAGIVVAIFGFWSAAESSWQGTINGIIGVWLFLSGVAFGLAVPVNFFVSGVVVGFIAIWNLAAHHEPTAVHAGH